jgi:hypothetical protein
MLKVTSYLGLALTVIAPVLAWMGTITPAAKDLVLVAGMLLWFGTALFWVRRGGAGG